MVVQTCSELLCQSTADGNCERNAGFLLIGLAPLVMVMAVVEMWLSVCQHFENFLYNAFDDNL